MQTSDDQAPAVNSVARKASRVRVVSDEAATPSSESRRGWLKLAASGAVLPAGGLLLGLSGHAGTSGSEAPKAARAAGDTAARRRIARDFIDPYIELVRLLREASEVEHSLMLQYLYAAFSIKPAYQAVAGFGAPNTND